MTSKDTGKDSREDEEHEGLEGLGYQPSANQTADHPMPASHDDDNDQASVRQNEEHWRRSHASSPPGSDEAAGSEPGPASDAGPGKRQPRRTPGRHRGKKR
jgi:hypothetical protein